LEENGGSEDSSVKTIDRRAKSAVLALRHALSAQEELMAANAAIDWSRADGGRAWEAAVRMKRATKIARRSVERFVDELEKSR
jgi:hypothetical protein